MPSVLKSQIFQGVAQTKTVIVTAGSASTLTVIGALISNTSANPQHGSMWLRRASVDCSIITGGNIPVGNTLVPIGGEGKVVLMANDALVSLVDAGTADVTISYLEQT
jgi:hypothetical protein